MSEWQPMSTAPMQFLEEVLVYDAATEQVFVAQFECHAQPPFWSYDVHDLASGRAGEIFKPTHWMPLPSPPVGGQPPDREGASA